MLTTLMAAALAASNAPTTSQPACQPQTPVGPHLERDRYIGLGDALGRNEDFHDDPKTIGREISDLVQHGDPSIVSYYAGNDCVRPRPPGEPE